MGPNVKKLIIAKMSLIMIPPGTSDPFAAGIKALSDATGLASVAREATAWVKAALDAVKNAPGSTCTDDEAIAAEILRGIEQRKTSEKKKGGSVHHDPHWRPSYQGNV